MYANSFLKTYHYIEASCKTFNKSCHIKKSVDNNENSSNYCKSEYGVSCASCTKFYTTKITKSISVVYIITTSYTSTYKYTNKCNL